MYFITSCPIENSKKYSFNKRTNRAIDSTFWKSAIKITQTRLQTPKNIWLVLWKFLKFFEKFSLSVFHFFSFSFFKKIFKFQKSKTLGITPWKYENVRKSYIDTERQKKCQRISVKIWFKSVLFTFFNLTKGIYVPWLIYLAFTIKNAN